MCQGRLRRDKRNVRFRSTKNAQCTDTPRPARRSPAQCVRAMRILCASRKGAADDPSSRTAAAHHTRRPKSGRPGRESSTCSSAADWRPHLKLQLYLHPFQFTVLPGGWFGAPQSACSHSNARPSLVRMGRPLRPRPSMVAAASPSPCNGCPQTQGRGRQSSRWAALWKVLAADVESRCAQRCFPASSGR